MQLTDTVARHCAWAFVTIINWFSQQQRNCRRSTANLLCVVQMCAVVSITSARKYHSFLVIEATLFRIFQRQLLLLVLLLCFKYSVRLCYEWQCLVLVLRSEFQLFVPFCLQFSFFHSFSLRRLSFIFNADSICWWQQWNIYRGAHVMCWLPPFRNYLWLRAVVRVNFICRQLVRHPQRPM